MANSGDSGGSVPVTRSHRHHRQCRPHNRTTTPSWNMGQYSGNNGDDLGCYTVLSADLDDLASEARREFEYTYDVDPDPWELCLGW